MTRRGLRMRRELVAWSFEELASGRYRRSLSLFVAALKGDLL